MKAAITVRNAVAQPVKQKPRSKMFRRHNVTLMSDPVCRKPVDKLYLEDFRYYDKDGFELNKAEQKFYAANGLPVIDCLNHLCWQEPWFELEKNNQKLILDHSMFLCRASYSSEALNQLGFMKSTIPTADLLIKTRQKWGFDFALDAVADDGDGSGRNEGADGRGDLLEHLN